MKNNKNSIFHFFLPEAYLLGGLCGYILKHRFMIMSRRSLNNYQKKIYLTKYFEMKLHKIMSYIISNSNAVGNDLKSEGVKNEKLIRIYNGIKSKNKTTFPLSNKNKIFKTKEIINLVVVSNLIKYKGHEDLIKAMSIIKNQIKYKWKLFFVGRDDGIKHSLEYLARDLNISKNLKFLGLIEDTNSIWSNADISIIPSHEEGFSNSLIEGMSFGLPCIVTNVGGNTEAINNGINGLVVKSKSPKDLSVAILKLINDQKLRTKLGKKAKDDVVKKFNFEKTKTDYINLYKKF
tara:strand:- start:496 stop:1368 length:873 start_codon:yes stop_codon:yes gene_type:complete